MTATNQPASFLVSIEITGTRLGAVAGRLARARRSAFQILSRARRPIYLWQRLKAKARELAFIHAGNEFVADVSRVFNQLGNSENRRKLLHIWSQDIMIYVHESTV